MVLRRFLAGPGTLGALPAGMRIRCVEASDAAAIHHALSQEDEATPELSTWTRDFFGPEGISLRYSLVGDTDDGVLVTFALVDGDGLVRCFGTRASWRRRGAATALVGRVCELARRNGGSSVRFERSASGAARGLLVALGFREDAPGNDASS